MASTIRSRLYRRPNEEYLATFVTNVGTDECWRWKGRLNSHGYPVFKSDPPRLAHRVGYEMFVGTIPPQYAVDHLCNRRDCTNPRHLEAVTRSENSRRSAHLHCPGCTCQEQIG